MTEAHKDALRREVECPQCSAHFLFRRMRVPRFDAHGFETYKLACKSCGVSLAGIVDPSDRTPLLSVDVSHVEHERKCAGAARAS